MVRPPDPLGGNIRPELLCPTVGLLLVVLGWPLAARRVRPNRWYGLRVPATFADSQVWYDANALAGRDLVAMGVLLLVVFLSLPRVVGLTGPAHAAVCATTLTLGALVITVRGWRAANRMLRARRTAATGSPADRR